MTRRTREPMDAAARRASVHDRQSSAEIAAMAAVVAVCRRMPKRALLEYLGEIFDAVAREGGR